MKPTVGLVSMAGVIPVSKSFDSVGAMARSPADLAALTEIILDESARSKLPKDGYDSFLTGKWDGLHIGFLDEKVWRLPEFLCEPNEAANTQMDSEYHSAMAKLKEFGTHVEYPIPLTEAPAFWPSLGAVINHEFKGGLEGYLANLAFSEVRTLEELVKWNEGHADIELPPEYPSQSRLIAALEDTTTPHENAQRVDQLRKDAQKAVQDVMGKYNLDAIAILSDSPLASIAAAAGYPIGTMPLGRLNLNGRPFGMSVMVKNDQEGLLLKIMSAWEASFPLRQPPPALVNNEKPKLA